MATTNLGRVMPIDKGNWSNAVTYEKLDMVHALDSTFVSKVDNNLNHSVSDTAYWQVYADGRDANDAATRANTAAATCEADHVIASSDHSRAESDHSTASADHSTASSDHTRAGTDHSTASTDHSNAASDHTRAGTDHTQASTDHSTAASDHTLAASDHTTAGTDHTQATTDHTTSSTYIAELESHILLIELDMTLGKVIAKVGQGGEFNSAQMSDTTGVITVSRNV